LRRLSGSEAVVRGVETIRLLVKTGTTDVVLTMVGEGATR